MDINLIRSAITVLSFIGFLALVARTYRRRSMREHDAASRLVFEGEPLEHGRHQQGCNHA